MAAILPSRLYCTPALIYLAIAFITVISSIGTISYYIIGIQIIFDLLWAWFLNFLCDSGYGTISWVLVFLPFILMLLMIFIAFEAMKLNMISHSMMPNDTMPNNMVQNNMAPVPNNMMPVQNNMAPVPNNMMPNNIAPVPNNMIPNNMMPNNISVNSINANSINTNTVSYTHLTLPTNREV